MTVKKPPQEPINTTTGKCDILMLGIRRTVLKISPHCWKRNLEFQASKKTKIRNNLNQWLLDKEVIKDFVQQLHEKEPEDEGVHKEWKNLKYYGYQPVIDKRNGMVYRIIWVHDDYNPEIIGIMTVYPFE